MISHSLILLLKLQDLFTLFFFFKKKQETFVCINVVDREDDVQLEEDGEEAFDVKDVLEQYNTEVLNESKQLSCGKWSCDSKISSKRKKK